MSKQSARYGKEPKSQHTPKTSRAAKAGQRHHEMDAAQGKIDAMRAAASIKEGDQIGNDPAGAGQVAMQSSEQSAPMAGQPSDSEDSGQ